MHGLARHIRDWFISEKSTYLWVDATSDFVQVDGGFSAEELSASILGYLDGATDGEPDRDNPPE